MHTAAAQGTLLHLLGCRAPMNKWKLMRPREQQQIMLLLLLLLLLLQQQHQLYLLLLHHRLLLQEATWSRPKACLFLLKQIIITP